MAGRHRLSVPAVLGIINLTPDSFSDGGLFAAPEQAVAQAKRLVAAGATALDLGAESTRPHAPAVDEAAEAARLMPALRAIVAAELPAAISIDTRRPRIAAQALELGASIINDVSDDTNPAMVALAIAHHSPLVFMHGYALHVAGSGTPSGVRPGSQPPSPSDPNTADPSPPASAVADVARALFDRAQRAQAAGLSPELIWLDPGLGFGKSAAESSALLLGLSTLTAQAWPVLIGPSRKRFLRPAGAAMDLREADAATAQACAIGLALGASAVRVHAPQALRTTLVRWRHLHDAAQSVGATPARRNEGNLPPSHV